MEKSAQKSGAVNLVALLLVGSGGYVAARYGNTLAGQMAGIFMGIGMLVALVTWFQMRLEERERLEKLEFDELNRSAAGSGLFNVSEAEVFPAQRSREQFEKYFVPSFTVLLLVLQAGAGVLVWRWLQPLIPGDLQQPTVSMALFGILALLLFVLGKFSTSVARIEKSRLLRPGASYLLLSAYICFCVTGGIAAVQLGAPKVDLYVARFLCVVLVVVAAETLVNLILELYRPRVKGKIGRPVYESRLVSLLGQPEGLVTTAAQTLDYQFGFKVSETWVYRFFERALLWLLLLQFGVLVGSTCLVFVDTGQEALLERFGRPIAVLQPGAHFKLPWPISRAFRYPTQQIQTLMVGSVPDAGTVTNQTVLWTTPHSSDYNFLVANRELASPESITNDPSTRRPPPVSLLTVSIPVQYQITNLEAWVYNHQDPAALLQYVASREVVRYLVNVDLEQVMSTGRSDAEDALRKRIQDEADSHQMGVNILFVGLQDIHPPVKVAQDYEKVVAAVATKEATILSAKAEAVKTNALASASAVQIVSRAEADQHAMQVDAQARSALFTNQLPAYRASPLVYDERAYLETFGRSVADARKYILLCTNTQDVVILDLEDKIRQDILDTITVPPPRPGSASK
jgi:membrane protease subunit HflK